MLSSVRNKALNSFPAATGTQMQCGLAIFALRLCSLAWRYISELSKLSRHLL